MIKERKTREKEHLSFVASFEDVGKHRLVIFKDSKDCHWLFEQVDAYLNKDIYRAKRISDEELTNIDENLDLTLENGCKIIADEYFSGEGKYLTVNSLCDATRVLDVDDVSDKKTFDIDGLGKFYFDEAIIDEIYPTVFTARSLRSGKLYLFDECDSGDDYVSWDCLPVTKSIIDDVKKNYGVLDELNHKYRITSRKGSLAGEIERRYK